MCLNGMAVLLSVRKAHPRTLITETHPKALVWALTGKKWKYHEAAEAMDHHLSEWLGCQVETQNDYEWDAGVSAYAALCGIQETWHHDLFDEHHADTGSLIFPSGQANYWWPE
jgi:hypothetical protein